MSLNDNRLRKSDLDILKLDQLFSIQKPEEVRSTISHSFHSFPSRSVASNLSSLSKKQINLSMSSKDKASQKGQSSVKGISQKLQSLSDKLNHAKKFIKSNNTPSPMFINLNQRYSELNISIKNHGMLSLKFIPEENARQQKELILNRERKRKEVRLKMGRSRIEDFTDVSPKPKHLVPLAPFPHSHHQKKNYFIKQIIRARNEKYSLAIEHLTITMQIMKQKRQILDELQRHDHEAIILSENPKLKGRKTLILDLDETLIHCSQMVDFQADIVLDLTIGDNQVHAQIILRPYVITFLKKISKIWQVVIFTASHQQYADGILNEIDSGDEIFHHRLYRQHCTELNSVYIKDLSRLNRDLSRVVLVDNSAYSYMLHPQNGIPIFSYYNGYDSELSSLQAYLAILQKSTDVRQTNMNYFKLHQYQNYDNPQQLIKQLYIQDK